MLLVAYVFFKGVEQAVGVVDGGWLNLAPSSFGGEDRRWRAMRNGWGAYLVDGLSPRASTTLTQFKATVRWDLSSLRWCSSSSSAAMAGDDKEVELRWFTKDPGAPL